MKKHLAVGAGIVLLSLPVVGVALAQPVYVAPGYVAPGYMEPGLPPYAIMSIVRSTGLTPLTRPMRRGPNYILVAVDRSGRQMRVVVDARRGEIVNLHPAFAAAPYGAAPHGAAPYGAAPYGAAPYGAAPYGAGPYGAAPYGAAPYGPDPYGSEMAPPGGPPHIAASPSEAVPPAATYGPRLSVAARPNVDAGPPPRSPRVVPGPRLADAPNSVSLNIADPPPPPLPRPRPKLASNEAADEILESSPVVQPPAALPPVVQPPGVQPPAVKPPVPVTTPEPIQPGAPY